MQHREQAWETWANGGGAPGPHRGHTAASRIDFDAGYDAALDLAAQLAAALDGLIGKIETDQPIIMRDLKPSREALATYRAAREGQEATR